MLNIKHDQGNKSYKVLNNEDLINVFKFKLMRSYNANLDDFFFAKPCSLPYNHYLFNESDNKYVSSINLKNTVLEMYRFLSILKTNQIRSVMFMSRFAAGRHSFKDFRFKFAKYVDFRVSLDIMRAGDAKIFNRIKLPLSIFVSVFNMSLFVRPFFLRKYAYRKLPGYFKLHEIYTREAWFKRATTSFYSYLLKNSLLVILVHAIKGLLPFIHALQEQNILNVHFKTIIAYFFSNLTKQMFKNSLAWLVLFRGRLYENLRYTGLIAFDSSYSKQQAKRGFTRKARYVDVAHFAHYYPFTYYEKYFRRHNFEYSDLKIYEKVTKTTWLPRKFAKAKQPEMLNIGYLLNNYFRPSFYSNKTLIEFRSGFYPITFKKSLSLMEHPLFPVIMHKFTFNRL
jgi:hypothetical protein